MMSSHRKLNLAACLLLASAGIVTAQQQSQTGASAAKPDTKTPAASSAKNTAPTVALTNTTTPVDLARSAYNAHGGDRFRNLKNTVLRGSIDLYSPNSTQALAGQFAIVMAGDKFRMEIQSPAFTMRSIYDGVNVYSSMPQFQMPPLSRYGYAMLTRFDQSGHVVSALADKKKIGFRIATEESATDFYLDPKTGRIQRFSIPVADGVSYGVEHKTFKEIEGVLVPVNFTIKFETPQGIFYAEAKSKVVLINQALDADVFAIPTAQ